MIAVWETQIPESVGSVHFPGILHLNKRALGGEVQHQAPAYTADFEAAVCISSLIGRENVGDAQRQNALLDLPY